MRVLTWNLFHGRSLPETRRSLLPEFAAALGGWDWDVALLQEVPPWWPPALARASGADWARTVLTSRNQLLGLRRAVASRRPDLLKSGGGGANAILVRSGAGVVMDHRRLVLTRRPERRVAQAVALRGGAAARLGDGEELWIANLHATQAIPVARSRADGRKAARWLRDLAGGEACILGGDLNDRSPDLPGFTVVASRSVDHVLVGRGLRGDDAGHTLRRARTIDEHTRRLSDHPPLRVTLERRLNDPFGAITSAAGVREEKILGWWDEPDATERP